MARANHDKKIPVIIGQWRTGEYSIRDLAKKHDVSIGFVAKHTAGIEKDGVDVVNAGVLYQQGIRGNDEHFVNAVNSVVEERTRHVMFFNNAAIRNVQDAMETPCANQYDFKARADTISKGREVVLGKTPDTAIQINNTQPVSRIERAIVDPVN